MNHNTEMLDLTIAIPTRNHPQYISYAFQYYLSRDFQCHFLVLDSSSDKQTRDICTEYYNKGLSIQYQNLAEETTPDEKERMAMQVFQTKYLWLCGDGIVIKKEMLSSGLLCTNYHALHFVDSQIHNHKRFYKKRQYSQKMIFKDVDTFSESFFWTGTFMGSFVIDKDLSEWILSHECAMDCFNTGFYRVCATIEAIGKRNLEVPVCFVDYCHHVPYKRESTWMTSEEVFEIWCNNMPNAVEHISAITLKTKESIIKTTAVRNGFLSIGGLIRWRAKRILNHTTGEKYQYNILRCSNVKSWELRLICRMPVFLCRIIRMPYLIRKTIKDHINSIEYIK